MEKLLAHFTGYMSSYPGGCFIGNIRGILITSAVTIKSGELHNEN